jgi:DNA-binding transcriptional MerR regulator
MLQDFPVHATAAAMDLDRARGWYEEKLGLVPEREDAGGVWYRFAGETWLYLYGTPAACTARNTIAGWTVTGIEAVMADLHARGVAFEDYDFGEMKTVNGLADFGTVKAAWFKDSEGNTFELSEVTTVPSTALDIRTTPRFAASMRIGELAKQVGVSTDTVRFYERSGWLPPPSRRDNDYREYRESDVEHLRLLIDLRRLDVPLGDAGQIANWCHSGHCANTTEQLPRMIAERRAEIADRIAGLQDLDARLAGLTRHITRSRRTITVLAASGSCCEAANAVLQSAEGCSCCSPASALAT